MKINKGFRFYFDKDFHYLLNEEIELYTYYYAIRSAKRRLRMYANLFTRDLRKTMLTESSFCIVCKSKEKLHLDHIIPITKGGRNEVSNIQLLCSKCNISKSNKI